MRSDPLQRASSSVDVWRVDLMADLDTENMIENLRLLSPQERIRAEKFLRAEPRTNYINRRCVLRDLLAAYLQLHPADVAIETTEFGKPFLVSQADAWLCFNVAHSEAQMLVAIANNRRIGVDIERMDENLDHVTLIRNYFAPDEQAEIAQLDPPDRPAAFFDCWTRKEAYLKAVGHGLSTSLNSFAVSAKPNVAGAFFKIAGDPTAANWTVRGVPVAPGYAAAIAAEGEILEFRWLDYVWAANRTGNARPNC